MPYEAQHKINVVVPVPEGIEVKLNQRQVNVAVGAKDEDKAEEWVDVLEVEFIATTGSKKEALAALWAFKTALEEALAAEQ